MSQSSEHPHESVSEIPCFQLCFILEELDNVDMSTLVVGVKMKSPCLCTSSSPFPPGIICGPSTQV